MVIVMCSVLAGCAAPNNSSWWNGWGALASAGEDYQFDFAWELRGDDRAAPLQVFSTTQQLWLQFANDRHIPALFALRAEGLVPLKAQKRGVYHVVNDSVEVLLLRRGEEQAWAYRAAFAPALANYLRQQQAITVMQDQSASSTAEDSVTAIAVVAAAAAAEVPQQSSEQRKTISLSEIETMQETSSGSSTSMTSDGVAAFTAQIADHTFRQLLRRWAPLADWVFNDEHWTVAVDIPISGPFLHEGAFTEAVQRLLLSTQLGDYPLRPCFYSNQVLRVVSLHEGCMPHTEEVIPLRSSAGLQTSYPEKEVFVSLPWVAGRSKNRLEDAEAP